MIDSKPQKPVSNAAGLLPEIRRQQYHLYSTAEVEPRQGEAKWDVAVVTAQIGSWEAEMG
jgi:hypothetical protein